MAHEGHNEEYRSFTISTGRPRFSQAMLLAVQIPVKARASHTGSLSFAGCIATEVGDPRRGASGLMTTGFAERRSPARRTLWFAVGNPFVSPRVQKRMRMDVNIQKRRSYVSQTSISSVVGFWFRTAVRASSIRTSRLRSQSGSCIRLQEEPLHSSYQAC